MINRRLAAVALLMTMSEQAYAGCTTRPIGMSESTFTGRLAKRLHSVGVRDISRAETDGDRDAFLMAGMKTSLFITRQADLIKEIGFVLSDPADSTDLEKMLTAAAYTASSVSGTSESAVKSKIYDDLEGPREDKIEFFPPAAIIIARPAGGTVVKVSLTKCDP